MSISVTCDSCKTSFNAPDTAAGKRTKCPKCGGDLLIPVPTTEDDILDAVETAQVGGTPVSPRNALSDDDLLAGEPPIASPSSAGGGDGLRPCPMCGEMIQKAAVKCRHCGEIFDPTLRKEAAKRAGKPEDQDLTGGEWALALICSGIGCIMGIIWMIQGKPKGKKMFLISFLMQLFWVMVRAVVEVMNHAPR